MDAHANPRVATLKNLRDSAFAAFCLAVLLAGPVSARQSHSSPPVPASASGPPVNLVPWPLSDDRRPLIDQIHDHEERNVIDAPHLPKRLPFVPSVLDPDRKPGPQGFNDEHERLRFGRLDSPFGSLSLISREVDEYGRIRSVDFLAFDDPNSKWDVSVRMRHGAMFRLTRKWGYGGVDRPFQTTDKSELLPSAR
jgi:hypothetical protein